jgi:hypothetical protein
MTRTPTLRSALTALVMGGAAALAFAGPAAADEAEDAQPFDPQPEQLVEIVPEAPQGGEAGQDEAPGGPGEEAADAPEGEVQDVEVIELPDDVWCLLTDTCEDGEAPEGGTENCEMVHTPFGKILVCDEEEPEPPEGCEYLLGLDGEWTLHCPDDEPPPEECHYLLDHDNNWILSCPPPPFDPCEDPEDGGTPVGCEEDGEDEPEETPADKGGLPLTGTAYGLWRIRGPPCIATGWKPHWTRCWNSLAVEHSWWNRRRWPPLL